MSFLSAFRKGIAAFKVPRMSFDGSGNLLGFYDPAGNLYEGAPIEYTWAGKPAAAAGNLGDYILITNAIETDGARVLYQSDGTDWIQVSTPRVTWAKAKAATVGKSIVGFQVEVSNYGLPSLRLVSDGTDLLPDSGSQILYAATFGPIGTPTNTISGAAGEFTLPADWTVPADLLVPGKVGIRVKAKYYRNGAVTTTITNRVFLGNDATLGSNSILFTQNYNAADTRSVGVNTKAWFHTATTATRNGQLAEGDTGTTGAAGLNDINTAINTATDMKVRFGITTYSGGTLTDIIQLVAAEASLEVS